MKVYDGEGHLIMDIKEKDLVFKKTLDFTDVPTGQYSINIKNKDKSYFENLNIK